MPALVLCTLNARYAHASLGLRCLHANLGDLAGDAEVLEFDLTPRSVDVVEAILARRPRIVAFGVYIWNVAALTLVVQDLKRVAPGVAVILGGPEVSHDAADMPIVSAADYVIAGEGEAALPALSRDLLAGRRPLLKRIEGGLPDLTSMSLPYDLYSDEDLRHRVVYVEASRGCPFHCEFCLSSLDEKVRRFPLDRFLNAMQRLLDRGLNQFKFVDRTFNLDLPTGAAILDFFLARRRPGLFLHFEMIPDRFPDALRERVAAFPAGMLQFEVGIQTFNEAAAERISRRQDNAKAEANLRWLVERTGVHVHADLIVGLPGEDMASFAAGFDRLVAIGPQEIQVGVLKRLRGAPISRHDEPWGMAYSPAPPYEVLQTGAIDFATMQSLRRLARYWDLLANSGRFGATLPLLWRAGSPFHAFLALSDWLYEQTGQTHALALPRLVRLVREYLTEQAGVPDDEVDTALERDGVLKPPRRDASAEPGPPPRQRRHLRP